VLDQLLRQLPERTPKFSWEVRIAANAGNIFSSPDGTIYVDDRIARLLGSQSGLWAAALSHEIAHVIHRDWARRYLFQKSLQQSQSSQVLLGAGGFAGAWLDASSSSRELAEFCRAMELEADATSVWLMARAGFHPDFVPALHHVLQAGQFDQNVNDPNHPRWHERDLELHKSYIAAGREYDRLWLSSYGSAGDGPPVVVYLSSPETRPDSRGNATIIIPLRCQNLSGSVEVVLEWKAGNSTVEQRQFTGCTSNRTLVAFTLPGTYLHSDRTEVSVLDDAGGVLNRSLVAPKAK
jgi:predicted Zn-dependent protease